MEVIIVLGVLLTLVIWYRSEGKTETEKIYEVLEEGLESFKKSPSKENASVFEQLYYNSKRRLGEDYYSGGLREVSEKTRQYARRAFEIHEIWLKEEYKKTYRMLDKNIQHLKESPSAENLQKFINLNSEAKERISGISLFLSLEDEIKDLRGNGVYETCCPYSKGYEYEERAIQVIEKKIINLSMEEVEEYLSLLLRKYQQLVTKDDYGNLQTNNFLKEIHYFIQSTLNIDRHMQEYGHTIRHEFINALIDRIYDRIVEYSLVNNTTTNLEYDKNMSPTEYEHFCKDILLGKEWVANVTQQSGDQGVDVIAEFDDNKVAIQCKLYSSPVGNKAVQEVFAAMQHIGASHSVVVTNNTYTRSAKELANTTGVLLLHHEDLKTLHEKL